MKAVFCLKIFSYLEEPVDRLANRFRDRNENDLVVLPSAIQSRRPPLRAAIPFTIQRKFVI